MKTLVTWFALLMVAAFCAFAQDDFMPSDFRVMRGTNYNVQKSKAWQSIPPKDEWLGNEGICYKGYVEQTGTNAVLVRLWAYVVITHKLKENEVTPAKLNEWNGVAVWITNFPHADKCKVKQEFYQDRFFPIGTTTVNVRTHLGEEKAQTVQAFDYGEIYKPVAKFK